MANSNIKDDYSVYGFKDLFRPDRDSKTKQEIRFGSTLLISGPPGAGKTTFALALVRALMAKDDSKRDKDDPPTAIAYYISSEVQSELLQKNFKAFGWFRKPEDTKERPTGPSAQDGRKPSDAVDDASKQGPDRFRFTVGSRKPDFTNFYAISPTLEVDRPVPSPEELVNGIFNSIVHTLMPSEAPKENPIVYVIIDSITALLKGCVNAGEERRQTHEIMQRLKERFDKKLALVVLLAEQDHRSQDSGITHAPTIPTVPSVEDYLADIVFRLYVRNLPLGRRGRVLEVVKSQGADMRLGEHTWQIISNSNSDEIIHHDAFRDGIMRRCLAVRSETSGISPDIEWGGIVVFPRPDVQPATPAKQRKPNYDTGTEGLWVDVSPGRVTLIAGPMGGGKTTLCRQFLSYKSTKTKKKERFLISFDSANQAEMSQGGKHFKPLYFTQSQFDLNVLVAHINWILNWKNGCDRLAFDGLSEWLTKFDKPEAARVLEALMLTVKQAEVPPAVFMTFEMPLGDDPLDPATLGAAADNLVVVRKVPINDELRKVIYVLKNAGGRPEKDKRLTHQFPGELRRDMETLWVDTTSLEAFTGLLSANREVKRARALVQLFAENRSERRFNRRLERRLKRQHETRIELTFTRFDLSEIGSTLETALDAGKPAESFNLAIHSVDEWWLKALNTRAYLGDLAKRISREPQSSSRPGVAPDYRDFWWFEVEKAWSPAESSEDQQDKSKAIDENVKTTENPAIVETVANTENSQPTVNTPPAEMPEDRTKNTGKKKSLDKYAWYAVPGYLDFGMFCINLEAIVDPIDASSPIRERWKKFVADVPRLWVRDAKCGDRVWFDIQSGRMDETVLEYAIRMTGQAHLPSGEHEPVFTFDSSARETCACMLFELAWSFGASEGMLADQNHEGDRAAVKKALMFLQFLVLEGLLPERSAPDSPTSSCKPILFSRHWYSTLRKMTEKDEAEERKRKKAAQARQTVPQSESAAVRKGVIALPFMPSGQTDPEATMNNLLDDIGSRQSRWLERARLYRWRFAIEGEDTDLENLDGLCGKLSDTKDWSVRLRLALEAYHLSRRWLLNAAVGSPPVKSETDSDCAGWGPDLDDLMELGAWMAVRLQLLFGDEYGKFSFTPVGDRLPPAARVLESVHSRGPSLPDLTHLKPPLKAGEETKDSDVVFDLKKIVATGYVCSGSWMFGVDHKSRSSQLKEQILNEMTSLDAANMRAKCGAGMPARKDFFHLRGHQPVDGMEYLTWRELLRYSGSRAMRRDGVLVKRKGKIDDRKILKDPSPLYQIIYEELLACLRIAELYRRQYAAADKDSDKKNDVIKKIDERAANAVGMIYEEARVLKEKSTTTIHQRTPSDGQIDQH